MVTDRVSPRSNVQSIYDTLHKELAARSTEQAGVAKGIRQMRDAVRDQVDASPEAAAASPPDLRVPADEAAFAQLADRLTQAAQEQRRLASLGAEAAAMLAEDPDPTYRLAFKLTAAVNVQEALAAAKIVDVATPEYRAYLRAQCPDTLRDAVKYLEGDLPFADLYSHVTSGTTQLAIWPGWRSAFEELDPGLREVRKPSDLLRAIAASLASEKGRAWAVGPHEGIEPQQLVDYALYLTDYADKLDRRGPHEPFPVPSGFSHAHMDMGHLFTVLRNCALAANFTQAYRGLL